jgi:predicted nucleotidyltransferase
MDRVSEYVLDALRDYGPERILLFGSRARGSDSNESDVDLLVVKDDPRRPADRIREVYARLQPLERADEWMQLPSFDVIVITARELRDRLDASDPFFETIVSEGRTILDRSADAR